MEREGERVDGNARGARGGGGVLRRWRDRGLRDWDGTALQFPRGVLSMWSTTMISTATRPRSSLRPSFDDSAVKSDGRGLGDYGGVAPGWGSVAKSKV